VKCVALLAAVACALSNSARAADSITCAGVWAPTTSEAASRRQFGRQVRSEKIDIGEGEREDGTVVYPDAARSRVYVFWKDTVRRQNPSSVRLRDESRQASDLPVRDAG
jgi:hypothetical protein